MRVRFALCAFTLLALAGFHLTPSDALPQPQAPQSAPVAVSAPSSSVRPIDGQTARQARQQAQEAAWYAHWAEVDVARAKAPKARNRASGAPPGGSHRTDAEVEACILARENGGSYGRSSNPTHFGAYQYDRQTWVAHGGDPADWGTASPEEQDRVFHNGVSQYGYGAWRPYDGC